MLTLLCPYRLIEPVRTIRRSYIATGDTEDPDYMSRGESLNYLRKPVLRLGLAPLTVKGFHFVRTRSRIDRLSTNRKDGQTIRGKQTSGLPLNERLTFYFVFIFSGYANCDYTAPYFQGRF